VRGNPSHARGRRANNNRAACFQYNLQSGRLFMPPEVLIATTLSQYDQIKKHRTHLVPQLDVLPIVIDIVLLQLKVA
jgi:hypothetical protein